MVISWFLIIAFSQTALAIEFEFSSPESVFMNEPFNVEISSPIKENLDVKIIVLDENKNTVSEIFNNGWKNPYYYLKSVYPNKTTFRIRAASLGNHEICARLRKTGKSSFTEKCNEIIIKEKETEKKQDENNQELNKEKEVNTSSLEEEISEENNTIPKLLSNKNKTTLPENKIIYQSQKRIILAPREQHNKPIESENQNPFSTKQERFRNLIIYSFLAFCVFIILLLSLNKL
jgi:predicted nucleic acid-binding Zn ribbon protein